MDFMRDTLANGRAFRTLNIVDDHTRECPVIEVDHSLPGRRVVRVLDRLAETRGLPGAIGVDNGPEFTGRVLDHWAYERGVHLYFIDPGKPVQNAFVETFNGKFRDECLNEHWFVDLHDARRTIETYRRDYNSYRPHSSLGGLTPEEFASRAWPSSPFVRLVVLSRPAHPRQPATPALAVEAQQHEGQSAPALQPSPCPASGGFALCRSIRDARPLGQ